MTVYKSGILACSLSAIHSFSPSAVSCSTSLRCLSSRDSRRTQPRKESVQRAYATVSGDGPAQSSIESDWPDAPKGQPCPTPYQIFHIPETAPYSKARFYELVKLYHPDRGIHNVECCKDLSHDTKLERYRLIVAAHTILSDPAKRSAYDRWGAGWAGKAAVNEHEGFSAGSRGQPGPFTHSWRGGTHTDSTIWTNATWEDWERWRQEREGTGRPRDQAPLYFSNSTFVSLIIVVAAVGSSLNYNRAETESGRFLAARDAVHDQTSKDLRKVRQVTNNRAKDERIEWFVRNREAALGVMGWGDLDELKAQHVLPRDEHCMPEEPREGN